MSSKKFNKIAKRVIKENREVFKALEEFDKTKKLITKIRMTFTIDKDIARDFKDICRKKGYNMSRKVEQFMKRLE